jgi:hypothetical protein
MDLSVRSNESGAPKSRKFSQIIGSRHTWYHDMLRKVTSQRLRQTLAEKLIQLNTKPFEYPRMHPDTRANLAECFAPHNAQLAHLIGRDLSHWR